MSVMPKGAEELLIALQTPSPKGHLGIPALLWGAPGEGKSSFVESLRRDDFPVVTLIASIHDPTDFSGLPVHLNGQVRFAPPEWTFAFDETGQGILFLDELTTAPPSVQAALLRVILERKVGFRPLPKGVRVVAAANPPDQVVGGWELSPPLRNRFVHIRWELSGEIYQKALREGFGQPSLPVIDPDAHAKAEKFWRRMVEVFLQHHSHLAKTSPSDEEYAFASPRTWDFAIALMASCDLLGKAPKPGQKGSEVFLNLVEGCVGKGAAVAFAEFLQTLTLQLPDPDEVLDGKIPLDLKSFRDDELYAFFSALADALVRRQKKSTFVNDILVFLRLVKQVSHDGRIDAIFAPLRRVAQSSLFLQAMKIATRKGQLEELQQAMSSTFEETPLKEFVNTVLR
jgi:hypothetical protein